MVKVSIVVPAYNCERYLKETLDRLLNQTIEDIEYIFIDDGSTDRTYEILQRYAQLNPKIKLYKKKNEGPGVARNYAMNFVEGEYVLFLDADDIFEKDMVEVMLRVAQQEHSDIVICHARIYNEFSGLEKPFKNALQNELVPKNTTTFNAKECYAKLFQITAAFVWNKLFRVKFIKDNQLKFAETYTYEDMAFLLPALVLADKISVTPEELVKYRVNNEASLCATRDKYWQEMIYVLDMLKHWLKDNGVYEQVEQSFLNRVLTCVATSLRQYENAEAFEGLFFFFKQNFWEEFDNKKREFFYNEYDYLLLQCFAESISPLDFVLKYRKANINIGITKNSYQNSKYWLFPHTKVNRGSSILLYGAGDMGQDYYFQIRRTNWCNIVHWVDKNFVRYVRQKLPVQDTDIIANELYDNVVVCIVDEKIATQVKEFLIEKGIDEKKIILPILPEDKRLMSGIEG